MLSVTRRTWLQSSQYAEADRITTLDESLTDNNDNFAVLCCDISEQIIMR